MPKALSPKDPLTEERAIVALATFQDDEKVLEILKSQGVMTTTKQLENKRISAKDRIEKSRKEIAPQLEQTLTADMLDIARVATELEMHAIDQCLKKLKASKFAASPETLAKIAREVSQLKAQTIDKKLALEGRPTSITESRNQDEILRSLEAMGVVRQVDAEVTAIEE